MISKKKSKDDGGFVKQMEENSMNGKQKKILLISPTITSFEQQIRKQGIDHNWWSPHYGTIRLASFLKANGHDAEYFDTIIELLTGENNLEKKLKEKKWDIVGFSLLNATLLSDMRNMYLAEKICPNALIIAGGVEAQFNYQTVLDKTPCNIVIMGEGENPMLMLANGVPKGDIPGIIFKNDAIPLSQEEYWKITESIEWENIPYEKYWDLYIEKFGKEKSKEKQDAIHTARIFSKNRCPFRCKFCSSINQHPHATGWKPAPFVNLTNDNIISIIERIQKAHPRVRTIYFTDDDFCYDKDNVIDFCRKVIDRDWGLRFMCQSRITDLNEDVIQWMVKANFRQVNVGIESFSQKVLTEIDKKCKKEVMQRNLDLLEKYNLHAGCYMVLITPQSTLDDLEETVDETLRRLKNNCFSAGFTLAVVPLKGTRFYEEYSDFLTQIHRVEGTNHLIKKDLMILADDPIVREIQLRHYYEIDRVTEEALKDEKNFHKTNFNKSIISLNFLKQLIDEAREKYKKFRRCLPGVEVIEHE